MARIQLERLPETDSELYELVKVLWGVTIPRHKVCPDHVAPFEVFADAYFRRGSSISLWHGSRGLSGKSFMLSILGLTIAFLRGSDVNILGGSLAQSTNVHEHMRNAMDSENSPRYMIETEAYTQIKLTNKARIRPLTASQKTVRGPHPATLLCDEIDEMEEDILNAALGQPMPQTNYLGEIIKPYTILCSTWQNSDGTFEHKYREFQEKGLPIRTWCFKDTSNPIDGWLSQETIDQKKLEIPAEMWRTEYCASYRQPILTPYGYVLMEDILVGDKVLTRKGWKSVIAKYDMGEKETLLIETRDSELRVTSDHRILTGDGWKPAGDILVGESLASLDLPSSLRSNLVSSSTPSHRESFTVKTFPVASLANDVSIRGVSMLATTFSDDIVPVVRSVNDVVSSTQQTEMIRVDAGSDVAVVLDCSPIGDWSNGCSVTNSVREVVRVHNPQTSLSVPLGKFGALPDPASLVVDNALGSDVGRDFFDSPDSDSFGLSHVESISYNGVERVYDITVEGEHEFVADGIVIHNCLGEPSIGNRAFDTDAVEKMFSLPMEPLKKEEKQRFEEYTFEEPVGDGIYIAAADWAKEQDFTVISVIRLDVQPHTLVYYMRVNRRPYPAMIKWFNDAIERYNAEAIHDATGLGNVVNDYIDVRARKFIMTGEKRSNMLTEFVGAVERGYFKFPRVASAYTAHKYCRTGDLYSGSTKDYHLPDEVCSFALAWNAGKKFSGYGEPVTVKKDSTPGKYEKHFMIPGVGMENNGIISPSYIEGVVVNKSEGEDDMSFSLTV